MLEKIFSAVKSAGKELAMMDDGRRNEILQAVSLRMKERETELLTANEQDLFFYRNVRIS